MNFLQYQEVGDEFKITSQWEAILGYGLIAEIPYRYNQGINITSDIQPGFTMSERSSTLSIQGTATEKNNRGIPNCIRVGHALEYLSNILVYEYNGLQYAHFIHCNRSYIWINSGFSIPGSLDDEDHIYVRRSPHHSGSLVTMRYSQFEDVIDTILLTGHGPMEKQFYQEQRVEI